MLIQMEEALRCVGEGSMLIVADDEGPQAKASLFVAAERATKDALRFMAAHGRGLVCTALREERLEALGLPLAAEGRDGDRRALVASLDLSVEGGASVSERERTIRRLVDPAAARADFTLPGSVFVAKALKGGVLRNAGHAEAAADLADAAGLLPAGVYCDILDEDGMPLDPSGLRALAETHNLNVITIEALIAWRRERDIYVTLEAEVNLPTAWGLFKMAGFVNRLNGEHHVALVMGEITPEDEVLVRVHSECLTGDVFHSMKCDCGEQLAAAMDAIAREGRGILLYLRQEGRGIGLINKIKAYKLQEQGLDTEEANLALGFPADMRDYGIGAQILSALQARKLRIMTNNPKKLVGIRGHGIEVVERVPLVMETNEYNKRYFQTKQEKMGHLFQK